MTFWAAGVGQVGLFRLARGTDGHSMLGQANPTSLTGSPIDQSPFGEYQAASKPRFRERLLGRQEGNGRRWLQLAGHVALQPILAFDLNGAHSTARLDIDLIEIHPHHLR